MANDRTYFVCEKCGNFVEMIDASGIPMMCCGQKMTRLKPNTTDAAQEKHVPAAARSGGKLTVKIGEAEHPMTPQHHIAWVAAAQGNKTQRTQLDAAGAPCCEFSVDDGPVTVYAYCNLHGLWSAEA